MELHWNETTHLKDFIRLNNQWIEKYFQLEEFDLKLANDPESIIRDGGCILSVTDDEKVLGVCALFKQTEDCFELARMAVEESKQGQGIGDLMLKAILEYSQHYQIRKLHLISNTKLKAAISLYKKFGFKTVSEGQHPLYLRGNIEMELRLNEL